MNAFTMIDINTFYTEVRGNKMTLVYVESLNRWEMYTENAMVKAHCAPGVKVMFTLAEVEKTYKSWRGISSFEEARSLEENGKAKARAEKEARAAELARELAEYEMMLKGSFSTYAN